MAPSLKQAPISCPGHTRPVVDISFSAETDCGSLFISGAKDGKAILRRGDTGDWIGTFVGHQGAVWSCVLDAHATKAATGSGDFTAKIWDTFSGQELLSITENHVVRCVDLSKTDCGAYLLTANNSKKMSVYDLVSPDTALLSVDAHDQIIRRVTWCNGDRHAITSSEDGTMKLWDLQDRKKSPSITVPVDFRQFGHSITDFQFLHPTSEHAGEILVAVTSGSTAQLFRLDWRNVASCSIPSKPACSFSLPCNQNSVSLHPNSDILVCGGEDHCIYRLDRVTGDLLETCKGHFGPVHCVRFSPDGRLYASGSEDGTVRLWQTEVGEQFGLWRLDFPVPRTRSESSAVDIANPDQIFQPSGAAEIAKV